MKLIEEFELSLKHLQKKGAQLRKKYRMLAFKDIRIRYGRDPLVREIEQLFEVCSILGENIR